jgi:hypothetical protein
MSANIVDTIMKIVKNFLKSEDRTTLMAWVDQSINDNLFFQGPPDRYILRLKQQFPSGWGNRDITDGKMRLETNSAKYDLIIPSCIGEIEGQIIDKYELPKECDCFISYHVKGGHINPHIHHPEPGYCDLRFNIFVNKTEGGDPVCDGKQEEVRSCDLTIFSSNKKHHSTPVKCGRRIVLSYGFYIQEDVALKICSKKRILL